MSRYVPCHITYVEVGRERRTIMQIRPGALGRPSEEYAEFQICPFDRAARKRAAGG